MVSTLSLLDLIEIFVFCFVAVAAHNLIWHSLLNRGKPRQPTPPVKPQQYHYIFFYDYHATAPLRPDINGSGMQEIVTSTRVERFSDLGGIIDLIKQQPMFLGRVPTVVITGYQLLRVEDRPEPVTITTPEPGNSTPPTTEPTN